MSSSELVLDSHLDAQRWRDELLSDLRGGLSKQPKRISPVWFYDERGSRLFDEITTLPEYFPTRAERSLLGERAAEVAALARADTLVELGSGTSDKTTMLLDAMSACQEAPLQRYVPFDVSEETLEVAARSLAERYPNLLIHGVVGDFHHHLGELPASRRRLVAFLGGTIGNLRPEERRRFLFDLDCAMTSGDSLLLGVGLVMDPAVLVAAYDDSRGVTGEFNLNALRVLNREVGADFDPADFEHVAVWDDHEHWIEMHLRARRDVVVVVEALEMEVRFEAGEEMLTEISAKFTPERIEAELWDSGFEVERTWSSEGDEMLLVLARPYC